MGTRGIMGLRIDGQDKLTYNHFDSYPDGLGVDMVRDIKAILANEGIDWFKDKARNIKLVGKNSKPSDEEVEKLKQYSDLSVGEQSYEDWYSLLRELQGQLKAILEAGYMIDSHEFIKDSLFCEWAYIVNLDDMVLEVYTGFQKEKHGLGRYTTSEPRDVYYPCALIATYPLIEIPDVWAEIIAYKAFEEA